MTRCKWRHAATETTLNPSVTGFVTLAILKSILTWNDFLWPLVMASEPKMMTSTVGIQTLSTAFYIEYTLIATGADHPDPVDCHVPTVAAHGYVEVDGLISR